MGEGPCVSGGKWLRRSPQERNARSIDDLEQGNLVRNYPHNFDDRSVIGGAWASMRREEIRTGIMAVIGYGAKGG